MMSLWRIKGDGRCDVWFWGEGLCELGLECLSADAGTAQVQGSAVKPRSLAASQCSAEQVGEKLLVQNG
jgi:hypothetical protein